MKKVLLVLLFLVSIGLISCQNCSARRWGGNQTFNLPKNEKLVMATWKDSDLWYLTRPMRVGEQPETLILHESSDMGIMNGTVTFIESK